jgi:hypothetical protein
MYILDGKPTMNPQEVVLSMAVDVMLNTGYTIEGAIRFFRFFFPHWTWDASTALTQMAIFHGHWVHVSPMTGQIYNTQHEAGYYFDRDADIAQWISDNDIEDQILPSLVNGNKPNEWQQVHWISNVSPDKPFLYDTSNPTCYWDTVDECVALILEDF